MAQGSTWIAIVDDDPSVLKSLCRTLRVHGHDSRTFSSAREFLTTLAEGAPACLILDVQMPGMTGVELHRHLVKSGIHIPTIVITARGDASVREAFGSADIISILLKPLRNAALFDAIAAALGSHLST
ncbi:response regulator transcription factor [Bosea sp. 2RAB26]|uniref:response regulator transcription factor n=1 Tax=Bosea sp. 2RAB26 TaxID=3237476 RepID=UPI003F91402D